MEKSKPPFRFVSCGRVYRSDYDATHTPMFHQLEGMVVGHDTSFAHLKGLMIDFCEDFFGLKNLPVRFRPSFFPFTEPSAEVDIGYSKKENEMVIGGNDYWMEILGCGMVHPNVLEGCGIDPNIYQGIAFGIGIERLVMLKYGFSDIRQLYSGDFHWISSCGFYPTSPL
jgi:phenylalanyl-tRNA synthetase alpha chain